MTARPQYTWQCPKCGFLGPTLDVPVIHVSHDCKRPASRRHREVGVVMAQLPLMLPARRRGTRP